MPAALIAAEKDSRSFRNTASLCSPVRPPRTIPSLVSAAVTSGDLASALLSLLIAVMIGSGVPVGARKPFQDENSKPGSVSDTDGMSGAAGKPWAVPTAISPHASAAVGGADRDQPDAVAGDVRQQLRCVAEIEVDLAGHDIGDCLRPALGRHHD